MARRYGSKTFDAAAAAAADEADDKAECKSCLQTSVRVRKSMGRASTVLMTCLSHEIRCEGTDGRTLSRLLRREVDEAAESVREQIKDQLRLVFFRYITAPDQDAAELVVDTEMDAAMCGHAAVMMDVRAAARSMVRRDQRDADTSAQEANRRRAEVARLMGLKRDGDRAGEPIFCIRPARCLCILQTDPPSPRAQRPWPPATGSGTTG